MKIYIVTDTESNEIVSINQSENGARKAVLHHLKTECYSAEEWKEIAEEHGYESVGAFDAAVLNSDEYDYDLSMMVDDYEAKD